MDNTSKGHRHRLRQRFLRDGLGGFHDYEVVELLLTLGTPRKDCKPLAKRLLREFGSLQAVLDADPMDLRKIKGVGEINQVGIILPRAVAGLYRRIQARECDMGLSARELFKIIFLENAVRIRDIRTIFEGTVDQAMVYPREVVALALKVGASRVVFAHNHPGGSLRPSKPDFDLTKKLQEACSLVGIEVLDHLIVSDQEGYYSMKEHGEI